MNHSAAAKIEKSGFSRRDVILLVLLMLAAAVIRFPALDTHHAIIGDELMWGNAANNVTKDPYFLLNACLHVVNPPVTPERTYGVFNRTAALPILLSVPIQIFGSNLFGLRFLPCLFGIALVAIVYLLGYGAGGRITAFSAGLIATVLPMPVFMSRVALNEIFIAVFGFAAFYFILKSWKQARWYSAVLIGLLLGYGYLIKPFQIAVIIVPACLVLFIQHRSWRLFRWFLLMAAFPVIMPLSLMALKYWLTPWSVSSSWDSVWFSDNYQWKKGFWFYFISLMEQYALILPLILAGFVAFFRDIKEKMRHPIACYIAISLMILLISIPGTKKETYFFIIAPALFIVAGYGAKQLLERNAGKITLSVLVAANFLILALAVTNPERLIPISGIPYKILNPELAEAILPALAVGAALMFLATGISKQRRTRGRMLSGIAALVSLALILSMFATYWINQDDDIYYNRNYDPEMLLSVIDGMRELYGSERQLLIGDRPHASATQFYSGTIENTQWVPRFEHQRPAHATFVRRNIFGRRFILFADCMRYPLSRYRSRNELPDDTSVQMTRMYKVMDKNYKRVPDKVLKELGIGTKIPFYILKDLSPREILSDIVKAASR